MLLVLSSIFFAVFSTEFVRIRACTTLAVGRKATTDGSVMSTHSNDGGGTTDPRLIRIPARDYLNSSRNHLYKYLSLLIFFISLLLYLQQAVRPIYASPEGYPRYVGTERGAVEYYSENCQAGKVNCVDFQPMGYIPQVNHTYAYLEDTYGALNEMQVGIAESTCSGVYASRSIADGGKALLSIDQLSQIAMERAKTAKEAVSLMGQLGEQYGFYGESASFEGGSESLIVTDPQEAWVFHILADPTGASAIWGAARVPDDSVAVVANMFSIREMDLSDSANFLGRTDMWELAAKLGLYKEGESKDFTATFSDGEYAHKYYSGRRMWGVFRLLAPSANLPSSYGNLKYDKPYPFAVPVDKNLLATPQSLMAVMRDWYDGTEYTTGPSSPNGTLAGGAFQTPDRYSGSTGEAQVQGNWERTIALFRSSDTYITQSRSWLPASVGGVLWFGAAAAHSTVYVPIMAGALSIPTCFNGWQGVYDLATSYWASRVLLNVAQIKFDFMIQDIRALQNSLESESQRLVDELSGAYKGEESLKEITERLAANALLAQSASVELMHSLLFKYADGYMNTWTKTGFHSFSLGYPAWWLKEVGYENGPPPVEQSSLLIRERQQQAAEAALFLKEQQLSQSLDRKEAQPVCTEGLKTCLSSCAQEKELRSCSLQCLSKC